MVPKALQQLVSKVSNKQSIIRMPAKKQYNGISLYDVTSLVTKQIHQKKCLNIKFFINNIHIGISATNLYAYDAGDKYEYLFIQNDDGCVILKSYCPMDNVYS